ncbi:MAG: thiamine pyrophosphate-binding protein [Rhodanobacteraceae bacterium]
MSTPQTGAGLICETLHALGVDCVFGLPGTQNVTLYEALRTSALRTVVATNELSAAMMANGYYRASGRLAAVATIPGPGFTWAMTGVAEAYLDSAALLHLVGQPATAPGERFQLQAINQAAMAGVVVKSVQPIERAQEIASVLATAHAQALGGEPGPVLIHIARKVLDERVTGSTTPPSAPPIAVDHSDVAHVVHALAAAKRCVVLAGQGSFGAADLVAQTAERLSAAVVTTTSGRGVVAEDHPLSLGFELGGTGAATLNALIVASDVVLAIGCKFSHNASRGFRLRIPPDKLIHIDASAEVLNANYPAGLAICADARAFLAELLTGLDARDAHQDGFGAAEIADFRERGRAEGAGEQVEPRIHGVPGGRPEAFFAALRRVMPRASCLVTDSGLHQVLARRHFRVLHPRGFITPTNLQSMGFAIGAAIGACLADRERPVVALIGDGGLAMSGLELLTAVRERLRLTVIVFVDGAYGLIRAQQLDMSGHAFGTVFSGPDIAALAETVGAAHVRLHNDPDAVLHAALESRGVTIVEVALGDSLPMHWMRAKGVARNMLGPAVKSWMRRLRRRG